MFPSHVSLKVGAWICPFPFEFMRETCSDYNHMPVTVMRKISEPFCVELGDGISSLSSGLFYLEDTTLAGSLGSGL